MLFDDQTLYNPKQHSVGLCLTVKGETLHTTLFYTPPLKIDELKAKLGELRGRPMRSLRIFTIEGVEIYEDDLKYVKANSLLYTTDGTDFDQSTSFSIFQIIKQLGVGGFGKVLLGRHKITNETVAIKIINTRMVGNAQDIDMVFREAELMKSLRHNNIVKIHNCFTLPNMQVVIVMEYLQGGELLEYLEGIGFIKLERGRLSEEEARGFFEQMVNAIHYCHQQKLIHRDLKLENILLKSKNSKLIKIVDFGIAGVAMQMNVDKIDVGSLSYMAPEVLSGKATKIGPSIDVWALGVILFGMVTGQLPFTRQNQLETYEAIINVDYSYPQSMQVSSALKDLIQSIFIIDVNERIKLMDVMNHPWYKSMDLTKSTSQIVAQSSRKLGFKESTRTGMAKVGVQTQSSFKNLKKELTINSSQGQVNQNNRLPSSTNIGIQSTFKLPTSASQILSPQTSNKTIQYPLIKVVENKVMESDPKAFLSRSPKQCKYITKNYEDVLKKFKTVSKTFRGDLTSIMKLTDTSDNNRKKPYHRREKSFNLKRSSQLQIKVPSPLQSPNESPRVANTKKKSNQPKGFETFFSKLENNNKFSQSQRIIKCTQLNDFSIQAKKSIFQDNKISHPSNSDSSQSPPRVRRGLQQKLEGMLQSKQYDIQVEFMQRKKNMDTLFVALAGQSRSPRLKIKDLVQYL